MFRRSRNGELLTADSTDFTDADRTKEAGVQCSPIIDHPLPGREIAEGIADGIVWYLPASGVRFRNLEAGRLDVEDGRANGGEFSFSGGCDGQGFQAMWPDGSVWFC
jgi:hypothetical protein